jgi:hypothetical protein
MATDENTLVFNFCKEKGGKRALIKRGNFNLVLCFLGAKRRESRPPKRLKLGPQNPKPSKFWFFPFQEKEIT